MLLNTIQFLPCNLHHLIIPIYYSVFLRDNPIVSPEASVRILIYFLPTLLMKILPGSRKNLELQH